jgi:enoyl-CoA hydratase/3-hydroxyacyl-CoA dehydrogenase
MIDEGVCSIEDCDIGARVGLRWSEGPFQLINRDGLDRARARVEGIVKRYPDLTMPALLKQAKGPFSFELVKAEVEDGLAEITLNRPDALNALNEEVVAQLAAKFDEMEGRDEVSTIVLRGAGKAFVAGADIRYFVKRIEAKDFERIQKFTEEGQELYRRIDESDKLVIARLDGLSLGGGSELALCADWILATDKGSLGFPETGIGIYPGLGGTQRTRRRIGPEMTRYLLLTGDSVDAQSALAMGLVDEVVSGEEISSRIAALHAAGKSALPNSTAKADLPPRLKALREFFAAADLDDLLAGKAQVQDPAVGKAAARVARKAPLACRVVDAAIARGEEAGLQAGLQAELSHLQEIFSSEDAYEGLSSLGRRRPEFKGR